MEQGANMPKYNYLKDYLTKDEYIVVKSQVEWNPKYTIQAISVNPLNPRPYVTKKATLAPRPSQSAFAVEFGTTGRFFNDEKSIKIVDLTWDYHKNYYEHEYEIVVVLAVRKDKIVVYSEKTEKEIDIVCSKNNILTPYAVDPLVGHELLIKPKSADTYAIVHNITLAELKSSMHQRML